MFFNKSTFADTSGVFTRKFHQFFSSFHELKVYSGINKKADAIFLGIIDSKDRLNEAMTVNDTKKTTTLVNESDIGNRTDFLTPTQNDVNLELRVILIKNPTFEDIKLLQSDVGKFIKNHPKVIFDESMTLSTTVEREFQSFGSVNEGGVTNFTYNHGNLSQAIETMADSSRDTFEDLVIYAF